MKKSFYIFILALLIGQVSFSLTAFARPANPNLLPKVEPLLLPPADVTPNYSGNVDSSLQQAPLSGGKNEADNNSTLTDQQQNQSGSENLGGSLASRAGGIAASVKKHYILWPIFLLALLALAYWGYKKNKSE